MVAKSLPVNFQIHCYTSIKPISWVNLRTYWDGCVLCLKSCLSHAHTPSPVMQTDLIVREIIWDESSVSPFLFWLLVFMSHQYQCGLSGMWTVGQSRRGNVDGHVRTSRSWRISALTIMAMILISPELWRLVGFVSPEQQVRPRLQGLSWQHSFQTI